MTNIQTIPLAQLRLSPRNVRKTGSTVVDELPRDQLKAFRGSIGLLLQAVGRVISA